MDSTQVESISNNNNNNNNNNKLDHIDDSYEDDFEKDIDSEESSKQVSSPRKASDDDQDIVTSPSKRADSPVEKGQQEVESPGKERPLDEPSDNDSEPDADAYNFTEDQKRAMMELMVQKQEDVDLLDEEPPEYNVKGRLEQLNAELANDPGPVEGERESKVVFKAEIVDLVAPPPPDYSDDESQPNSARGEHPSSDTAKTVTSTGAVSKDGNENKDSSDDPNKKQYVVERDGNFSVLSANELTPSERAMLMKEEPVQKKSDKQSENQITRDKSQNQSSSGYNERNKSHSNSQVVPRPPARPRPNTATTSAPRRNVRPAQSPRPKSAGHSSNSTLEDFNYNSPYAMTPEQKEEAREEARRREEERREKERKRQEEEEEKRKDNDSAFQAWLERKRDAQRRKEHDEGHKQSEQERSEQDEKKKATKTTDSASSQDSSFESYEIIYPYLLGKSPKAPREEADEAYKTWLKEKRTQGKKEKLLKRRQQQEQMEAYYLRPREDCDKAFKEWLKKKNADIKRQQAMERQKNRMYRIQVKRSKKTQALVKALKESQAFRYVDYYGYRY